jgi:glycosyltransferase involved in cell wall biosynthesis
MDQPGEPALEVSAPAESEKADIVIGIPSYNNARTIGHVVRAAQAGLAKYFPQFSSLIVNSDGGSTDGTRDIVLSTRVEDAHLLMHSTPQPPVHRLSLPYHGIPGKGSAFRFIFQVAERCGARACAVMDSDLRSITPEWIDLLVRPVLYAGYDFVAPYYHRHKYDGTITNSIVYPLTRALYGQRVRQPIGGDFGVSRALLGRYLARPDWETDVARYGIDIWMTTIALAEGFRVCQSFLGAKLHDAKDPGSDLSAMLHQVVGSIFLLMQEYEDVWRDRNGSAAVDLFGFRFDVGLDPIAVDVNRMLGAFQRGAEDLSEIWSLALDKDTLQAIRQLARDAAANPSSFRIPDELWTHVIYDFARAHRDHPPDRAHLLKSLTPLYLGRVASFVLETGPMVAGDVEDRIESLCVCFEQQKANLVSLWNGAPTSAPHTPGAGLPDEKKQEVLS